MMIREVQALPVVRDQDEERVLWGVASCPQSFVEEPQRVVDLADRIGLERASPVLQLLASIQERA